MAYLLGSRRSVDHDGELAQVVVLDRRDRLPGRVERGAPPDLDLERRPRGDPREPVGHGGGRLAVVALAFDAAGTRGLRVDAVRPRDHAAVPDHRELLLPAAGAGEHEGAVQAIRRELAELPRGRP